MSESFDESIALIVEDDPDLVGIFSGALEMSGYKTHTVDDGEKAISFLSDNVPAIVLLDLHLPKIFGGDVLRKIRSDGRLTDTKVILATADYRTAEDFRDSADLVLLKPISFKQLRDLGARLRQIHQPPINHDSSS